MNKINIIVFGKNGQVGSSLVELFNSSLDIFNLKAYSSKEVDFSNLKNLRQFLDNLSLIPDFIINAAAYTAVDNCETEKELADIINHQAVKIIADFSAQNNIKLIHYSTDYVFDGSQDKPFKEDNITNLHPLNFYGKSKLASEQAIINSQCHYIILRTSWVYSKVGKNFVNTIIRLAQEQEIISIVKDQIGSPTYAQDIALHTIEIIKKSANLYSDFPQGIYHLTNLGYVSWYDFAAKIVEFLKEKGLIPKIKQIKAIKTSAYKTPAQRPLNSRLDHQKIIKTFGIKIRKWQEAVKELIKE